MKRVVIVSPLSGDVDRNVFYAELALLDSVFRGEAPYASHLLLPRVLDDKSEHERALGMEIGQAWGAAANLCAIYLDLGSSTGMAKDVAHYGGVGVMPEAIRYLRDDCAIPDERLVDIYTPIRDTARNRFANKKIGLLVQLFPRLFADEY